MTAEVTMSAFAEGVPGWLRAIERSRNTVRQTLVARQVAELVSGLVSGPGSAPAPLRVLDVGCGQGTQALALARAGHVVTGLDPSDELRERFTETLAAQPPDVRERVRVVAGSGERAAELAPGPFDLLLCHGVLMYYDDPRPLLAALGAVAAPGAALSLLVRNGLAPAMRPGLRGESAAALAAFDRPDYVTRLGLPARMHTPDELDRLLTPHGWTRHAWYGVRVFSDHRGDPGPDEIDELIEAEAHAGRRDPYRAVASLLHVQYRR